MEVSSGHCDFKLSYLDIYLFYLDVPTASPLAISLTLSIIIVVIAVTAVIYIKFKMDISLFLRDTLGCYHSTSGGIYIFSHVFWIAFVWQLHVFFHNYMIEAASQWWFCLYQDVDKVIPCWCLLRWKEPRCLFDVLQEWHRGRTEWTWQKRAEECFGRQIWLQSLSLWPWRLTRERYVFNMHFEENVPKNRTEAMHNLNSCLQL